MSHDWMSDLRRRIESVVEKAYDGPPRAFFTIDDQRLAYTAYGCWGNSLDVVVIALGDGIVNAIEEQDRPLTLAWRRHPTWDENNGKFYCSMRFVLYDDQLEMVQLPEPLIKAEGEAFKEVVV